MTVIPVDFATVPPPVAAALLAHQGGWDEALLVATPLAVIGGLLWLANRRVSAQLNETGSNDVAAGDVPAGDVPPGAATNTTATATAATEDPEHPSPTAEDHSHSG